MSLLKKSVQQVRRRASTYKPKLELVEEYFLSEQTTLPVDIFRGLDYEKNERQSSNSRDVIIVRSKDRETDRDEILRNLNQAGIQAQLGTAQSSVDPIDGEHEGKKFRILVKPISGGMAETTLNASITELFPCIAFETKYTPRDTQAFHKYLLDMDIKSLKCIGSKDLQAAQETINKADTSSKFEDKMTNAIAITKFLTDQHNDKPIQSVFWGYRQKPSGVPSGHPGDMFLMYADKSILGVSLKAGGKKTSEPQLNTYTTKIFDVFKEKRIHDTLMKTVYSQIYSKIPDFPAENQYRQRSGTLKTVNALRKFDQKNNKEYELYYNQYLEIMRNGVIDLFNKNREKTIDYIRQEVLRDAPDVPTLVIKAIGDKYEEVTDKDALGVFLPQVQFVKAYSSKSSKQSWFIELKSGQDKLTMNMSIRTNKSGNAGQKKLGQFSLAVKYNGLQK